MGIGVPIEMYNDIMIMVEYACINGFRVSQVFTFIFGIGYELFVKYYRDFDIKTSGEMLSMLQFMRNNSTEMAKAYEEEWFMSNMAVIYLNKMVRKHDIDIDKLDKFINDNKMILLGNSKVINKIKVEIIVEKYLSGTI